MQHPIGQIELLVILLVLFAGVIWYVRIAQHDARAITASGGEGARLRLKSFFLAGGALGTNLTENNTLGMTFAWAGGTWFFATTAYAFGPLVLLAQIPWCLSIVVLGRMVPRIVTRIRSRTIHGFLATHYGRATQYAAALATTICYVVNAGFEIFWPSLLFSLVLGEKSFSLPVALGLATTIGAYCAIGGYRSNATVDRPHNILGVATLAALLLTVTLSLGIHGPFLGAVLFFVAGSALYCGLSGGQIYGWSLSQRTQNVTAVLFAITSIIVVFLLAVVGSEGSLIQVKLVGAKTIPWFLILGMITFQIFFNVVDMQGWQQIAANEDVEPRSLETWQSTGWSIIRASMYIFWFPALGGVLLGCAMRLVDGVDQYTLFPLAFGLVLPNYGEIVRGIFLGTMLLGFLSTSMSTVDSLLMSAMQTLSYDVISRGQVEMVLTAPDRDSEDVKNVESSISKRARALLIPAAMLMALAFYGLFRKFPDNVLLFQPLMYAAPLALLAPVLVALYKPEIISAPLRWASFIGIGLALLAGAVMLFALLFPSNVIGFVQGYYPSITVDDLTNWLPALMPLATNVLSCLSIGLGILVTFALSLRKRAVI